MKLYVYNPETMEHVATISGADNAACEEAFGERFGDEFAATYSPAFGTNDGLIENPDAEEFVAS